MFCASTNPGYTGKLEIGNRVMISELYHKGLIITTLLIRRGIIVMRLFI